MKHSLKWLSVIALSNDRPRNLISNRLFLYNIEKHFVLCTSDITPVVHGPFSLFLTSLFAERLAKATEKKETYFSRHVYQESITSKMPGQHPSSTSHNFIIAERESINYYGF